MSYSWTQSGSNVVYDYRGGEFFVDATQAVPTQYYYLSSDYFNSDFFFYGGNINEFVSQFPTLQSAAPTIYSNIIINISASSGNDLIIAGSGYRINNNSTFNFFGSDLARYNIDAGDGNDNVSLVTLGYEDSPSFVNGGSGNDTLSGAYGADTLLGGSGNDIIYTNGGIGGVTDGGDGNDVIYTTSYYGPGYSSPDAASGGNGDDILIGYTTGDGLDYLYGDAGNDTINGGSGDDVLNGGADDDRLVGGVGDDSLDGGTGEDLLIGGPGWDNLTGGAGADVFGITAGTVRDYITDFTAGTDKIRIDTSLANSFAALEAATDTWVEGNWGVIQFTDGPMLLLLGVDTRQLDASWFEYAFV